MNINELAIKYANAVDDPENASWHTRYSSFKYAYQKAREDLESLLTAKDELIREALEVIGFYGNAMDYSVDDYYEISGEMRNRVILYSDSEELNDCVTQAGKRARTFLAKKEVKEILEKKIAEGE